MYQTTCHVAGQLKVNHRFDAPGAKDPVNWVLVHMVGSPVQYRLRTAKRPSKVTALGVRLRTVIQ